MRVYNKRWVRRLAIGIAVVVLGIMMWMPRGVTSTGLRALHPKQELPIITVCPEGPPVCQFAKIQEAINAAPEPQSPYYEPTAEIRVAPGTYKENLQLISKVVLLKGAGKDQTLLRTLSEYQPVILIAGIYVSAALIEGFTIEGIIGLAGGAAGAHIRGNKIVGGIFITGSVSSGLFEENEFFKGTESFCGVGATGIGRINILRNAFQDVCDIRVEQALLHIPNISFQAPGERVLIEDNQGGEIVIWESAAIAIRQNKVREISLYKVETALIEANEIRQLRGRGLGGIRVEASSDVVVQKNSSEGNRHGIAVLGGGYADRRTSVAILGNRVIGNDYGIVAESLEYITACQGNEVRENKDGDYVVGWPTNPRPSPELKQKCEGS